MRSVVDKQSIRSVGGCRAAHPCIGRRWQAVEVFVSSSSGLPFGHLAGSILGREDTLACAAGLKNETINKPGCNYGAVDKDSTTSGWQFISQN